MAQSASTPAASTQVVQGLVRGTSSPAQSAQQEVQGVAQSAPTPAPAVVDGTPVQVDYRREDTLVPATEWVKGGDVLTDTHSQYPLTPEGELGRPSRVYCPDVSVAPAYAVMGGVGMKPATEHASTPGSTAGRRSSVKSDPDPLCEGETDLTRSDRGPEGTPNPIEHTLMTHEATTTEARGWDALILGAQAARNLQQDIASQTAPAPAPAVQQEVQGVAQRVVAPTATDGR